MEENIGNCNSSECNYFDSSYYLNCRKKGECIRKEKPMNEKKVLQNFKDSQNYIFESEEQARTFIDDCIWIDAEMNTLDDIIKVMKDSGYIRKSELHILVNEAEEMFSKMAMASQDVTCWGTAEKCYQALQALRRTHPEFKK